MRYPFVLFKDAADTPEMRALEILTGGGSEEEKAKSYYELLKLCLNDEKERLAPTPWKDKVVRLMLMDHPVSHILERGGEIPYEDYFNYEIELFWNLYHMDFSPFAQSVGDFINPLNESYYQASSALSDALEFKNAQKTREALALEIQHRGLGVFAGAKLFKVDEDGNPVPAAPGVFKPFSQIVGYDEQKEKLVRNTRALIRGEGAMNTLLYGDMGTGKSSMVKALALLFKDTPLRFIEMRKGEFRHFTKLFRIIRETNYPFIIFVDDLSFEDGDEDYKEMKNALEGSFEDFPKNLVLYATSNRRSLVSHTKSERNDAVNAREILEEKMSLLSRFGLTIAFTEPLQDKYLEIASEIAREHGINPKTRAFREGAVQYAIRHLNRSGRTAEQYVKSLLAQKA